MAWHDTPCLISSNNATWLQSQLLQRSTTHSPQVRVGRDLLVDGASWNTENLVHFVNDAILNTDPRADHLGTNVVYLHIAL